jgi:hypothetical protein
MMGSDPSFWPWRHTQRLLVQVRARGHRNIGSLAQRWDMTLDERWVVSVQPSSMAIAIETLGDWKGEVAAPDASAGTGYYLGLVTGVTVDERGQVLAVQSGGAREKARRRVEALRHIQHTAGAELDRALDDQVLSGTWSRLLRRIALRTAAQDRTFTESTTFSISGNHPIPVAFKLTRTRAACDAASAPDSCLRVDLAGQADPAALLAGYTATTRNDIVGDISRSATAWLLLRYSRREPSEIGDRVYGREVWKTPAGPTEAVLEDELVLQFKPDQAK